MIINLSGLRLDIDIHSVEMAYTSDYRNGSREICWTCTEATDEIGENISRKALDLICNEYQSEIERAIWAQIEGNRS